MQSTGIKYETKQSFVCTKGSIGNRYYRDVSEKCLQMLNNLDDVRYALIEYLYRLGRRMRMVAQVMTDLRSHQTTWTRTSYRGTSWPEKLYTLKRSPDRNRTLGSHFRMIKIGARMIPTHKQMTRKEEVLRTPGGTR